MCKTAIAFILFVALSPGILLTIPSGSKGYFMSGQTSISSVLVHATIFVGVFHLINKCYKIMRDRWRIKRLAKIRRNFENKMIMVQQQNIIMGQNAIVEEIQRSCVSPTVVYQKENE